MPKKETDFTDKQVKAAVMLSNGRSNSEAAKAAGIVERTLYKWKDLPKFARLVKFLSKERDLIITEQAEDLVTVQSARADDLKALAKLEVLVDTVGDVAIDYTSRLNRGDESADIKNIPLLVRSYREVLSAQQATNDRLIGLEYLIEDVEAIKEKIRTSDEPVERRGEPT